MHFLGNSNLTLCYMWQNFMEHQKCIIPFLYYSVSGPFIWNSCIITYIHACMHVNIVASII